MCRKNLKIMYLLFVMVFISLISKSFAQITLDSLHLSWEPSVWYGTNGQRTVVIGDILYHIGGTFAYGVPYGFSFHQDSYIEYKDPDEDYWRAKPIRLLGRTYINAEVSDGKIYILGGQSISGEIYDVVEIYDPNSNSVVQGTPMPIPKTNAGSVVIDSLIYIIGGRDPDSFSNRVDVYNTKTNIWSSVAALPITAETEACYLNGKIYVIGGYNGQSLDIIYEYDIQTDQWTLIGHTPYPVSAHKLAVYQNYIFVIGDYTDLNRIMRFNVMDKSWTIYSSNFIGRRHTSVAVLGNKLYIIAGNSNHDGVVQDYRIVQSIDLTAATTITNEQAKLPQKFELYQNFPNPFNPSTNISYRLKQPAFVTLKIYNSLGQEVRTLIKKRQPTGNYNLNWDGKNDDGLSLPGGSYFYEIRIDGLSKAKKMILIK